MWARLSLKVKLTMLVVFIVAFSTYLLGRMMYKGLTDLLNKVSGLRAETVAAAMLDAIHADWFTSAVAGRQDDPEYVRMATYVNGLVDKRYIDRVEFIRFLDKQQIQHLLSVPADGSVDYRKPGDTEQAYPGDLYLQHEAGHHFVNLSAGSFVAGWVPIESQGKPVGLVIVYINATEIQNALDTANLAILITILVLVVSAGFAAFKFAASFEKTAVTDGLMGIYNHKYFKQRLEEEVAKARRYKQQTSLVLLDIDFFKRVNDTYGHATGDIVLKNLAKWVTDTCRNTDVAARYGGEEIAVILPFTSIAGAQEFAERLRLKVSQQVVKDPEEKAEFRVTISVGVAQWEQGMNSMDLIKRTDAALYHSKHMGRNRVTIYQEDILPAPEAPQLAEKR